MFFFTFLFRNLPNPKLLVHGPKASYVSKRTQSYHDLPKARASYRRRDNVMSYVTSGGWEGFSFGLVESVNGIVERLNNGAEPFLVVKCLYMFRNLA